MVPTKVCGCVCEKEEEKEDEMGVTKQMKENVNSW